MESSDAFAWVILAKAHKCSGFNDEAAYEYKRAIDLEPNNDFFYAEFGRYLVELQKFDEAAFYLEKALKLNPENLWAQFNYLAVLENAKKYDLALQYAEKVIVGLQKSSDLKQNEKDEMTSDVRDEICEIYLEKGLALAYHDLKQDNYFS